MPEKGQQSVFLGKLKAGQCRCLSMERTVPAAPRIVQWTCVDAGQKVVLLVGGGI